MALDSIGDTAGLATPTLFARARRDRPLRIRTKRGRAGSRAYDIFADCFERGLLIHVTGDIVALSPPLIVEEEQIDEIVSALADALKRAA